MEKQIKMMRTILYLYKKARDLINMDMPMSLIRENPVFDHIISIKYDVGNDELDKFNEYKEEIDTFYQHFIETNA